MPDLCFLSCLSFIYMNLFVSGGVKGLFTFIAYKLSLAEMCFCVFFKTVEAVKCIFKFIASIFSSLYFIYMKFFMSFETVWSVKWLFTFISPKVQKYVWTLWFLPCWLFYYDFTSDPPYLKHCIVSTNVYLKHRISQVPGTGPQSLLLTQEMRRGESQGRGGEQSHMLPDCRGPWFP